MSVGHRKIQTKKHEAPPRAVNTNKPCERCGKEPWSARCAICKEFVCSACYGSVKDHLHPGEGWPHTIRPSPEGA